MPTIVSVNVPLREFLEVLTLNNAVPLPEGVKLPDTPLGSPVTLQLTAALNPKSGVYWAVYVVDLPELTVWMAGEADTEKSTEPPTRVTVTWWIKDPLVPLMITVLVPAGAVIVRTVDPEPLTVGLEKL